MPSKINAPDFNLAATLECGQAFRWQRQPDGWFTGIVGKQVWRLRQRDDTVEWETTTPHPNPLPACGERERIRIPSPVLCTGEGQSEGNVCRYLALDRSLPDIVATFPDDAPLREAVRRHWGLRVLRQEPWETLASFIASSTKQIVQIRQIVAALARKFGRDNAFPTPDVVAGATLGQLRACKLGFRAEYLLAAARAVDSGKLDLAELPRMELGRAQEELMKLPGVGEKISNCVLLFSCGHDAAFPVDVWMRRSLQRLYGRKVLPEHFGPYAGWAQQYLFFDERSRPRPITPEKSVTKRRKSHGSFGATAVARSKAPVFPGVQTSFS
jgi:N-glycosylase/DNA lyase